MGVKKSKKGGRGGEKKPRPPSLEYAKDVEGMLAMDGTMLLVDKKRSLVFDATDRKLVGKWDGQSVSTDVARRMPPGLVSLPFQADPDDHCETPLEALSDLKPVLEWLGPGSIYDPYYCDGAMSKRLATLGFLECQHTREDCYTCWHQKVFDLLLTNPPYSGDHLDKLVDFCFKNASTKKKNSSETTTKSFCWLVPDWVHKRPSFVDAIGGGGTTKKKRPLYLSPTKRYVYEPPASFRVKKKSDTHKKTSPFHSIWIVWAGDQRRTDELADHCRKVLDPSRVQIARTKSQLRDLRRRRDHDKKDRDAVTTANRDVQGEKKKKTKTPTETTKTTKKVPPVEESFSEEQPTKKTATKKKKPPVVLPEEQPTAAPPEKSKHQGSKKKKTPAPAQKNNSRQDGAEDRPHKEKKEPPLSVPEEQRKKKRPRPEERVEERPQLTFSSRTKLKNRLLNKKRRKLQQHSSASSEA